MHKAAVGLVGLFVKGTTDGTHRSANGRTCSARPDDPLDTASAHQGAHGTGHTAHGSTFARTAGHRIGLFLWREACICCTGHTYLRLVTRLGLAHPVQGGIGVKHRLGRRAACALGSTAPQPHHRQRHSSHQKPMGLGGWCEVVLHGKAPQCVVVFDSVRL